MDSALRPWQRYVLYVAFTIYALAKLTVDLGKLAGTYYYANRSTIDPAIARAVAATKTAAIATANTTIRIATHPTTQSAIAATRWHVRNFIYDQAGDYARPAGSFVSYDVAIADDSTPQKSATPTPTTIQSIVETLRSEYGNFFAAREALGYQAARSWRELASAL